MEFLLAIIIIAAVFLFLGLCILVHEFGHLLVGLWRGLHVERFSIGFGKKLWGFERNGVEYRVSVLPFGGYVALPQLEPTKTPTAEDGTPLPEAKPFDRILTAVAGPIANIIFGFLLGSIVWFAGVQRSQTLSSFEVYSVEESSPEYEAGLRPGDHILQVNGESVEGSWEGLMQNIALAKGQVELRIERGDTTETITYLPAENPEYEGLGFPFFKVKTPVEILMVNPGSPAERAGLQKGDRILAVNGEPVQNTISFLESMWNTEGEPVDITVRREGQELVVSGIRGEKTLLEGEVRYLIGVVPGEPMVMKHLSPWWQFKNVLKTTGNTLGALFSSKSLVKPKHMSGPVGIIQMNYLTVRHRGWRQGLFFVVFVSFSLALFNLLPFPVLDGGHIMFGLFEMLTPWRVPEKVAYYIQATFAVALITLMLYVTFFDVRRVTRGFFNGEEGGAAQTEQSEEPAPTPSTSPN